MINISLDRCYLTIKKNQVAYNSKEQASVKIVYGPNGCNLPLKFYFQKQTLKGTTSRNMAIFISGLVKTVL